MSLGQYSPFGEMTSLRDAVNRLLEESYVHPTTMSGNRHLPLDVYETPDDLVVVASIPGATAQDLNVTATGDTLTLKVCVPSQAEQEGASKWTWYLHEVPHGEFTRTIDLPVEINPQQARARYENGVLRLELPKVESARQHKLKIQTGQPTSQNVNVTQGQTNPEQTPQGQSNRGSR